MPKLFVEDLIEGQTVCSFFLTRQCQIRQKKSGEDYLSLTLLDRTGHVGAVMWDGVTDDIRTLTDGIVVRVQGTLGSYQGQKQLTIRNIRAALPTEIDHEDYLPRSAADPQERLAYIEQAIAEITDPGLQALLQAILTDPTIRPAFLAAPAASLIHHAVLGGLVEHTAAVVETCTVLAQRYPTLDRDLLIAGAVLHDIGKVRELRWMPVFDYTDEGRLLGHMVLGATLIQEFLQQAPLPRETANRLLHLVLSHHGLAEYGAIKEPMTLEAFTLFMADDLDAKVAGITQFTAESPDPSHPGWTQYHRRLGRSFYTVPPTAPAASSPSASRTPGTP